MPYFSVCIFAFILMTSSVLQGSCTVRQLASLFLSEHLNILCSFRLWPWYHAKD